MKATLINKTNTPFCVLDGVLIKPYDQTVAEIPDDFTYDKKILAVNPIIENTVVTKVIEPTFVRPTSRKTNKKKKKKNTR